MRQYTKSSEYYKNRRPKKTASSRLSAREREFLNEILKLKNDNSHWNGHHVINHSFDLNTRTPDGKIDWSKAYLENEMAKELFESNPTYRYEYQRQLKSRILRKADGILSDADLLRSAMDKLRNL